jgi:hypothetical protein
MATKAKAKKPSRRFDETKAAFLYRFEFVDEGEVFLCYGITNNASRRKQEYERALDEISNWQAIPFRRGSRAMRIEAEFHAVRQASSAPSPTCGVKGTKTESFPLSDWELTTEFTAIWSELCLEKRLESV